MRAYDEAAQLLPQEYRGAFMKDGGENCEELRLRLGRRVSVLRGGAETELDTPPVSNETLLYAIEKATGASMHSSSETLKNGFINRHGLRIGVCGEAVIKNGEFTGYRTYTSVNIRIPRECRGICGELSDRLKKSGYASTLIISPPGGGKTTLLREIIRRAADEGRRVGVIDERNELYSGGSFELGRCADIVSMTPKAVGAMILLRGMNPEIIAMDEISTPEDIKLIGEICGCGVRLFATAHAESIEEMKKRKLYRDMLEKEIFSQIITIDAGKERTYRLDEL